MIRIESQDNGHWLVTPPPLGTRQSDGSTSEFVVNTNTLMMVLSNLSNAIGEGHNFGERFPGIRPEFQVELVELYQNNAIKVRQYFPPTRRSLWIAPFHGPAASLWLEQWSPWIEETLVPEGAEGPRFFKIPVVLPHRYWTAQMLSTNWGKGFTDPALTIVSSRAMNSRRRRWLGGNMDSSFSVCWGDANAYTPMATLQSYDSLFFDSVFNNDLQRDGKSWRSSPGTWGLGPGVDAIPARAFTTLRTPYIPTRPDAGEELVQEAANIQPEPLQVDMTDTEARLVAAITAEGAPDGQEA